MAAVEAAVAAVKFLALVQILVRPVWTFLVALFAFAQLDLLKLLEFA